MLSRWRLAHGLLPMGPGIVRTDADNTDSLLGLEIDRWYADLLANGPEEMLAPVDIAATTTHIYNGGGYVSVQLPEGVTRPLEVRLSDWPCAATIVSDPDGTVAARQRHAFTRATLWRPVAIAMPGGELRLFPASEVSHISTLTVADPADGLYHFDSGALGGCIADTFE